MPAGLGIILAPFRPEVALGIQQYEGILSSPKNRSTERRVTERIKPAWLLCLHPQDASTLLGEPVRAALLRLLGSLSNRSIFMEPPASVKSPQPLVLDCAFLASRYFRPYSSILFLLRR